MPRKAKERQLDLFQEGPSPPKANADGATPSSTKGVPTLSKAKVPPSKPKGTPRKTKGRAIPLSLAALEVAGVQVAQVKGHLALEERETGVSFLEGDSRAEITTANAKWIQRIESLGYWPIHVTIYQDGGDIRVYNVPKRIIQLPADIRSR